MRDGKAQRQNLCCPLKSTPDPKKCHWSGGQQGAEGFWCSGACKDGEIPVVSSTEPYIDDQHLSCWFGFAQYCCESSTGGINDVCGWTTECLGLKNGRPTNSDSLRGVCGGEFDGDVNLGIKLRNFADRNFVTTKRGTCQGNKGVSFCCDKGIDTSSCYWNEGGDFPICSNSEFCSSTTSKIDQDQHGGPNGDGRGDGTHECKYTYPQQQGSWSWYNADLAFCCDTRGMGKVTSSNVRGDLWLANSTRKPSIYPCRWSKFLSS
jgi:chitinase